MKKIFGILCLLIMLCIVTTVWNGQFVTAFNLENNIRNTALFGFISIGVALVIITGGIDLSIGSVIALTGVLLPMFLSIEYASVDSNYRVTAVSVEHKEIVLGGDGPALARDDRLVVDEKAGAAHVFSVSAASRASADGRTVVPVNELVGALKPSMRVSVKQARHMNVPLAIALVLLVSAAIGLVHGLLITRLNLRPFVVTLCGLLLYRSIARALTHDTIQGFGTAYEGLRYLAKGKPFYVPVPTLRWISGAGGETALGTEWIGIPVPVLILIVVTVLAVIFLNRSIYGRYLLALGQNEKAARFSGINTERMVILAYVLCSLLAGFTGILFALDLNSVQPGSHGNWYELYAIAAAVLGGCSLRGGEGSIVGAVIGTAVMRVLYNSMSLIGIEQTLEGSVIAMVILAGAIFDELVRRFTARRRTRQERIVAEREMAAKNG